MSIQGHVVSTRMGDYEFPNTGLRFDRLSYMKSLIDGLMDTQDSVTVRAGDVTVRGTSYKDIYEQFDRALAFLDGARWW